jgi:hypothetical protein
MKRFIATAGISTENLVDSCENHDRHWFLHLAK